jgi:hypothetical protein
MCLTKDGCLYDNLDCTGTFNIHKIMQSNRLYPIALRLHDVAPICFHCETNHTMRLEPVHQ